MRVCVRVTEIQIDKDVFRRFQCVCVRKGGRDRSGVSVPLCGRRGGKDQLGALTNRGWEEGCGATKVQVADIAVISNDTLDVV